MEGKLGFAMLEGISPTIATPCLSKAKIATTAVEKHTARIGDILAIVTANFSFAPQ